MSNIHEALSDVIYTLDLNTDVDAEKYAAIILYEEKIDRETLEKLRNEDFSTEEMNEFCSLLTDLCEDITDLGDNEYVGSLGRYLVLNESEVIDSIEEEVRDYTYEAVNIIKNKIDGSLADSLYQAIQDYYEEGCDSCDLFGGLEDTIEGIDNTYYIYSY